MIKKLALLVGFSVLFSSVLAGCTSKRKELGTEANPIKLFFVPSVDAQLIASNAKTVEAHLEKATGWKFKASVPASYVAVVEAFGTDRADVAILTTSSYLLANERYGAQALLTSIRFGLPTYRAQIIARADGPIKKIEDINGKRFAFVDPASASGYILPAKILQDNKVQPSQTIFASKHDNVVTMVYQKQVDAGATFYSPPNEGKIQDARKLVLTQYPDVEEKIKIVTLTDDIPNDPIVFRKTLPEEMKKKIADTLFDWVKTEEGKKAFEALYGITDLRRGSDADYNKFREILKALGKSVDTLVK